jgi:molybdopterin/thiamine biosynthesis adenylyltransferase/proteasome lid subunit RPN8/RPN11
MATPSRLIANTSTPVLLRLAEPELSVLLRLVQRRYPDYEWATFVRLGWRQTASTLVLTLADVDSPQPGDLDDEVGHVAIDEAYTLRTALAADDHAMAIGVVHSHPENCPPEPSSVDDDMDRYYAGYFSDFAPNRPYVSLITARISGEEVISGRVFWRGCWLLISGVVSERQRCRHWQGRGRTSSYGIEPSLRTSRLQSAFGADAVERLREASVAVIGAGGTGSAAIEVLARAGIGKLIVVDPDVVEESNIERLHGGFHGDADARMSKVEIAKRHIHAIDSSCEVVGLVGALPQSEVIDHVVTADLILGCTDQQHSRLALSDVSLRYLVRGLDCGVALEGAAGSVTGQIIQLIRFLPSDPCALCRRLTSPIRLSQELMTDEERRLRREQAQLAAERGDRRNAYWQEMPQLNTVGYLTTVAGALIAGYAIGWLTDRFEPPFTRLQMNIAAPFLDVTDVDSEPDAHCPCRRIRGMADQAIAEAYISAPAHWSLPRLV